MSSDIDSKLSQLSLGENQLSEDDDTNNLDEDIPMRKIANPNSPTERYRDPTALVVGHST